MNQFLRILVLSALVASAANAQIVKLYLKDAKVEKKYRKQLIEIGGSKVILGELLSGVEMTKGGFNMPSSTKVVRVFLANPSNPRKVPYRIVNGRRVPTKKKSILTIPREHLPTKNYIAYFSQRQNLMGLAEEYDLNLERMAQIKTERDSDKEGSKVWLQAQRRLIEALRRHERWLKEHGYVKATKSVVKTIDKEARRLKKDALEIRRSRAIKSVTIGDVPSNVSDDLKKLDPGAGYKAVRSQHLEIWFPKQVNAQAMAKAVEMCEFVIEGFRREFVDHQVGEDFPDWITDHQFSHMLWIRNDIAIADRAYTDVLGKTWGKHKDKSLKMGVNGARGAHGFAYNSMCRIQEPLDLEGMMVYLVGKQLANMHFAGGGSRNTIPWLSEGVAYYVCFEFLGRNIMTSMEWKDKTYDTDPGREGVKTVEMGQRASFNAVALAKGKALSDLCKTDLFNMQDPELAKSWSFFDFLARAHPKRINRLLRDGCLRWNTMRGDRGKYVSDWRADIRELFEIPKGKDPIRFLDGLWKDYAKTGQRKERGLRKR